MEDQQRPPTQPRSAPEEHLWVLMTCALLAMWGIRRLLVLALPDAGLAGLGVRLLAAVLAGLGVSAAARLVQLHRARRRGDT
ncbi:hypothetical protein AB0I39_06090 [Kitasatospora purpeofusca]|uniref:hypothetical protein n=1 Tax=Kitasatospora purpeofusca TaxID=67352 RepID=UPI0033E6E7A5